MIYELRTVDTRLDFHNFSRARTFTVDNDNITYKLIFITIQHIIIILYIVCTVRRMSNYDGRLCNYRFSRKR